MILETFAYDSDTRKWSVRALPVLDSERTLVLAFGAAELIDDPAPLRELRRAYPRAHLVGCSSAGEIIGTSVRDRSLSVAVARFEKTTLTSAYVEVSSMAGSHAAGQQLARKLARPDLRGVLVLSEGLGVNGSELVRGLNSALPDTVVVTGGLSGDGPRFKRTWVCTGDKIRSGIVTAVGFYGDHVLITHGSKGGWDKFGPERTVTRSEANVLYELDGKPALALYKEYLGDKAADLPASGLLFPLAMRASSKDDKVLVRTLLAVDHDKNSMTFAGDVPRGHLVQLMKADFERLIGGAELAAKAANTPALARTDAHLAVAISCVGRRLVLGQRTEEEVEAVLDKLPAGTELTGFYSYGEISPFATGHCDLHNQTMTLTVFSESKTPLPKPQARARQTPDEVEARAPARAESRVAKEATPEAVHEASAPVSSPQAETPPPATGRQSSIPASIEMPHQEAPSTQAAPASSDHTPVSVSVTAHSAARHFAPTRSVAPTGQEARGAGLVFDKRRAGDYLAVRVAGRMTETFKGAALAKDLEGQVVFDLAGVERITSFGVREWLQMLQASEGRVTKLFLARCSEPVVNQVSMIRKFAGAGQIVSFFAPYTCESCSNQFERLVDCEHDGVALAQGRAPAATCPRCSGPGSFDDDAQTYFGFVAQHGARAVPRALRQVIEELEKATEPVGGDAIEKTIDGDVTRVKVTCRLDAQLRWNRIVDGLEGQVVFDLGGVPSATPDGTARLESALRSLAPSTEAIRIEGCPKLLAERLAAPSSPPEVTIVSAVVEGRCATCSALRPVVVDVLANAQTLREGQDPAIPCKRCSTPLAFDGSRALMHLLGAHAGRATGRRVAPADIRASKAALSEPPEPLPPATPSTPPPETSRTVHPAPPRFGGGTVVALAVVLVLGVGGVLVWRERSTPQATQPAGASAPSAGWAKVDDLPPPWVERPFVIEGDSVFVVGRGGLAANEEAALAMARTDAVERLASNMIPELAGSPIHDFVQSRVAATGSAERRPEHAEAVARRFLQQVGAFATPERVDVVMKQQSGGIEAFARYKLPKQSYAQAVSSYRATSTFQGLVVGRFFPELEASIRTQGDLIVVDVEKNWVISRADVRPGDVVLEINGRPVTTVESFDKVAREEWASTAPNGIITVRLESLGARRALELRKLAGQRN
ncbi:FIST N-terminal domain-containing protein [Chondromyces apiculatus]|uniref:STAS domain-containing protein n=1 Tax=Chondromyces apiculatus DSM 436 TaxID=1192034 RepID=A0A017TDB4_9BACT|nr:FIST N-terminal domain-containing protein [Chondromyces apiculatus]EYF06815.1 Hypothetical protein CAP_1512 [Chondromyces apiculatus DSM 436]